MAGGTTGTAMTRARSHSRKIVLSIGVENRARTGGQRPICRPKPRCTSVSGPIRAVQVLARERISRCLSNWFSTPRPVVDAPNKKATDARSRSSPCKRDGFGRKKQKIIGTNAARATARRFHLSIGVQYRPCRCSAPLRVDRSGRRCFHADTSIDPQTGPGTDSPMQGEVCACCNGRRTRAGPRTRRGTFPKPSGAPPRPRASR